MTNDKALRDFAAAVEKLAFSMPAPNPYTPQFIQLCITAQEIQARLNVWPKEEQPDGNVTEVQPEDMTPATAHDASVIRDLEVLARDQQSGFWPQAIAISALRMIKHNAADAARYRWLRDKSEPGICAFYLSVGKAFTGVQFNQARVDAAIDSAIAALPAQS